MKPLQQLPVRSTAESAGVAYRDMVPDPCCCEGFGDAGQVQLRSTFLSTLRDHRRFDPHFLLQRLIHAKEDPARICGLKSSDVPLQTIKGVREKAPIPWERLHQQAGGVVGPFEANPHVVALLLSQAHPY